MQTFATFFERIFETREAAVIVLVEYSRRSWSAK